LIAEIADAEHVVASDCCRPLGWPAAVSWWRCAAGSRAIAGYPSSTWPMYAPNRTGGRRLGPGRDHRQRPIPIGRPAGPIGRRRAFGRRLAAGSPELLGHFADLNPPTIYLSDENAAMLPVRRIVGVSSRRAAARAWPWCSTSGHPCRSNGVVDVCVLPAQAGPLLGCQHGGGQNGNDHRGHWCRRERSSD